LLFLLWTLEKKKIIKKHSTTHNAVGHEMKANRIFKNKKSFCLPSILAQIEEYVIYDYLEHVPLSTLNSDLLLKIVADITEEIDEVDLKKIEEKVCPMNDFRSKKKY
jgi:hypothetical protein